MHIRNMCAGLRGGPAFCLFLALLIALALFPPNALAQAARLPVQELVIKTHHIQAEIAADAQTLSHGLMHRTSLPPDTGMLFVFDEPGQPCFWMKNTPLPLSIAFIDSDGRIVNTADMEPHSMASHCPAAPILYALEMAQGWFESRGIGAGDLVKQLPPANSAIPVPK